MSTRKRWREPRRWTRAPGPDPSRPNDGPVPLLTGQGCRLPRYVPLLALLSRSRDGHEDAGGGQRHREREKETKWTHANLLAAVKGRRKMSMRPIVDRACLAAVTILFRPKAKLNKPPNRRRVSDLKVALVRRIECVPYAVGSSPAASAHRRIIRAYCRVERCRDAPRIGKPVKNRHIAENTRHHSCACPCCHFEQHIHGPW
ncbi:hypothetical protein OKW45_001548 [Paraburkholderia sp. WSM4175]